MCNIAFSLGDYHPAVLCVPSILAESALYISSPCGEQRFSAMVNSLQITDSRKKKKKKN